MSLHHHLSRRLLFWVAALALLAAACSSSTTSGTDPQASPGGTANGATSTGSTSTGSTSSEQADEATGNGPDVNERSFAGTEPAPEFPIGLDWLNTEQPLSIAALRGKVVLLDFWTYGCINCIHIIPDLERLEREYPDELVIIGVHSAKFDQEGATENIRQVILRYNLQHPVVNDHEFEVWRTWGARAWPTIVVVDPAGNVVGSHSGEGVYDVVAPVIASLVNEFDDNGVLDRSPIEFRLEADGLPRTILSFPGKVHADPPNDRIFIADTNNNRVVQAQLSTGEVVAVYGSGRTGFDDGAAVSATFRQPQGMALTVDGERLYVADTGNHAVRAIDLDTGDVSTLAGTGERGGYQPGTAPNVALASPWALTLDGATMYVANAGTHQLWTIDLATLAAAPFAGNGGESTLNGPRADAELAQPSGLALDGSGRLYFADSESSSIRYAEVSDTGTVDLVVGAADTLFDFGDKDGIGADARLQHPLGVSFWNEMVYVADTYNSKIKVVDPVTNEITTLFGNQAGWRDGDDPLFYEPGGLQVIDGIAYVADTNNHAVRIIDLATGTARTLVLSGIERFAPPAGDDDYAGKLVSLPPVDVAEGPVSFVLDIDLPEGYKVNEDAPSTMAWTEEGSVAVFAADADRFITGTTFPLTVEATLSSGSGTVISDVNLIWCAENAESLCFFEQVRFTVPVTVGTGASEVVLPHAITLPEIG